MLYNNDYILRMIEDMGRFLRNVVHQTQGEEEEYPVLDEDGNFSEPDFLGYRINKLIAEKKINEAENLLFETIEQDPRQAYLQVALNFYEDLNDLPEEELEACDFSREEICDGLRSLCRWYRIPEELCR